MTCKHPGPKEAVIPEGILASLSPMSSPSCPLLMYLYLSCFFVQVGESSADVGKKCGGVDLVTLLGGGRLVVWT